MMDIPLRLLRLAVHVTACVVLLIAVITALRADRVPEAAGGLLLILLYTAGPAVEHRPLHVRVWLGLVTAGWVVLAMTAPAFVWLAFPLLFAYLHALPLWGAMFGVAVLTSAAIFAAAWHAGELTVPLLVGPGLAAAVMTLLALACKELRAATDP
ncbi:hypothetical protein SAMN05444920_116248 [Nonomuraea solani]|uniref:Uncharacterized protein n=1 Tax=Nonomuraea solani TaxID=1144553 RepID=A0A1H6ERT2_9ACTN|nr:hypothetical protein [Nonomuraea solani]SEH00512.1 hypothetical protein SAMN05444920_116248 [Nonomuraea solani]